LIAFRATPGSARQVVWRVISRYSDR
jgi:hypothetical protein